MNTPAKVCKICGNEYPATPEYFHRAKNDMYGFHRYCKQCRNELRRQRSQNDFEYAQKNRDRANRWRQNNLERDRQSSREYAASHKAEAVERVRQWRIDNQEKYKENNTYQARKEHFVKNEAYYRAIGHNYRARRRKAKGKISKQDVEDLYKSQNGLCAYCGISLSDGYHIDHVIPLSRGGTNKRDNIALACASCNCSKRDKLLSEWLPQD